MSRNLFFYSLLDDFIFILTIPPDITHLQMLWYFIFRDSHHQTTLKWFTPNALSFLSFGNMMYLYTLHRFTLWWETHIHMLAWQMDPFFKRSPLFSLNLLRNIIKWHFPTVPHSICCSVLVTKHLFIRRNYSSNGLKAGHCVKCDFFFLKKGSGRNQFPISHVAFLAAYICLDMPSLLERAENV